MPKAFITPPSINSIKKHNELVKKNFNNMLHNAKKEDQQISFKVLALIKNNIVRDLESENRALARYKKLDLEVRLAFLIESKLKNLFQEYLFSSMPKDILYKRLIKELLLCSFEQGLENALTVSSFYSTN